MTPSVAVELLPTSSSTDDSTNLHQPPQPQQSYSQDSNDQEPDPRAAMELDLLEVVSSEIEQMRLQQQQRLQEFQAQEAQQKEKQQPPPVEGKRQSPPPPTRRQVVRHSSANQSMTVYHRFPPACLAVLQSLPGNDQCVDCGARDPQWAAVSYGALLCLHCSGHHRSLGVQVSCVRSVSMDEWSVTQVLNMLEGGNAQLSDFFARHALCASSFGGHRLEPAEQSATPHASRKALNKSNVTRLRYKTKAALFYRHQMALHIDRLLQAPYRGRELRRTTATSNPPTRRNGTNNNRRLDHCHSTLE
eukprot:CAMPEP_0172452442 /NCGR_PEP_ID=MMETSP1065-20121228/10103_1 /TAXON_ID=265537 /ORGANISM="Amphiprora paludosa, Strain CCMP125" /LENGTH=302 /DNA_ID=CAMNT_0013204497 /DNA_START=158 /DNA_END=1066 /DNA_ORIENTATION=+